MDLTLFLDALTLQAGWNASVVCLGAAALGAGAGVIGVFALLRKRALMSDAISHATLPGAALAFIIAALLTGDGRALWAMLLGAAGSAALGVLVVRWITDRTRLNEDAAIGAVLSVAFSLGVVLLSLIQQMNASGQAGIEGLLVGAVAGMLSSEALLIAVAAVLIAAISLAISREFSMLDFDPDYAASLGWPTARLDLLMLGLLLAVVVIGLKTVGLVLIIALTIIPPAAARFWTDRAARMAPIAAAIGAGGCYVGAAISASGPRLPTGAVIVLCLFAVFLVSMLASPNRGLLASALRHWRFQGVVHARQGLLSLARGEPVLDARASRILRSRGWLRGDGAPTEAGLVEARRMQRDQALWNRFRDLYPDDAFAMEDWSLRPIEQALPRDMVAELAEDLRRRRQEAAAT